MKKILEQSSDFLMGQDFDALSVGVLDFSTHEFKTVELSKLENNFIVETPYIYYDLASLSKPLTNGIGFLDRRADITKEMELVLNHRGGLPAWGLLPKHGWKDLILAYGIKESETLYSDYSALRFMLEFEDKINSPLHSVASKYWHSELMFWKDLKQNNFCLQNGFRDGKANLGIVHDPNAFTINDYVSHAGLFGTITGVCETLINLDQKLDLLEIMKKDIALAPTQRFINGWDRAQDLQKTLAGSGCSQYTFGHLGFTGTSIWIDPMKKLGHVLLSNATKLYWYDKQDLNDFRRKIGQQIWQRDF